MVGHPVDLLGPLQQQRLVVLLPDLVRGVVAVALARFAELSDFDRAAIKRTIARALGEK